MTISQSLNAIATVSLRGTLEEKLKAAAAAGFAGVEIFENDLIGSALSPVVPAGCCRTRPTRRPLDPDTTCWLGFAP